MAKTKLAQLSYRDSAQGISLTAYADTIAYLDDGSDGATLAAIRFGGYPEQVRAMTDALWGGGIVEVQTPAGNQTLKPLAKQYHRQLNHDGVYAESLLVLRDDEKLGKAPPSLEEGEEQAEVAVPPRTYYLFTPSGDADRLFEEIDRKTGIPLIPEFREYLLEVLQEEGILAPITVWSCSARFDAWALHCSQDDDNIAAVLEAGLQSGAISIPGAKPLDEDAFEQVNSVTQYLKTFGVTMAHKIKERFHPLFDPGEERLSPEILEVADTVCENTGYSLYDAQLACAEALKRKVVQHQPAIIVAECGSGKTKIGAAALWAAHAAGGKRKSFNIVMCPSHVTGKWVREIEETVPNSFGGVIRSIPELQQFYAAYEQGDRTAFAVISKEKARDGYMKAPSVRWSSRRRAFLCPRCYEPVERDLIEDKVKYRVIAGADYFLNENSDNHKCEHCGEVLWSPLDALEQSEWVRIGEYGFVHRKFAYKHTSGRKVRNSPALLEKILEVVHNPKGNYTAKGAHRCYPLSTYIKHSMKGKIDGFIADELHLYAQNSGQGDAMAEIAAAAEKVIGMTATLINGYSSGIFHLLWRLFPRFMVLDRQDFQEPNRFNQEYGVTETTYELDSDDAYNSNRRTAKRKTREKLLPGVSPLVYSRFLLEHAVFLSLMDMGKDLPEYEEFPIPLEMPASVQKEYDRIQRVLRDIMQSNMKLAKKIMSAALNLLTVYPDQPYGHPPMLNPLEDGKIVVSPRDTASPYQIRRRLRLVRNRTTGRFLLPAWIDLECKGRKTALQPKDLKVLELVERKVEAGERVLIYTSWVRIDTQQKLKKLLRGAGYKVAVLPNTVAPAKREDWVAQQVEKGVQVLITNPSLVETGRASVRTQFAA